jgi:hypothetical protein
VHKNNDTAGLVCLLPAGLLAALLFLQGCAAVHTFPTVARAGDTVSVLVGGSAQARKEQASVVLTDAQGMHWDLQSLGLVRSLFNVRSDGRALGLLDAGPLEAISPWAFGHEPLQTVLVTDLPDSLPAGMASLSVQLNVSDNSSGASQVMTMGLEIIPGAAQPDTFDYLNVGAGGVAAANFARLEPAPHAEVKFGAGTEVIGAATLRIDFDPGTLEAKDLNVYVPELLSRDMAGGFGSAQRMVYWRAEAGQLQVDIIAPQGIAAMFLKLYVLHASAGNPGFHLAAASFYDTAGFPMLLPAQLQYFP